MPIECLQSCPPVAVIGLGNLLLSDEGVGVHVVRSLMTRDWNPAVIEFVDLGTGGMALLHVLAGRRRAVLVDCARMRQPPGTIRRFRPEAVCSARPLPTFSLHEADVLRLVDLARSLGQAPEEVVLFGIEPADLSPGLALSSTLASHLLTYCHCVECEVREARRCRATADQHRPPRRPPEQGLLRPPLTGGADA